MLRILEDHRDVDRSSERIEWRGEWLEKLTVELNKRFQHYPTAEFNRYGHGRYVPAGTYEFKAQIDYPELLTLATNWFPDPVTASYSWTADEEQ